MPPFLQTHFLSLFFFLFSFFTPHSLPLLHPNVMFSLCIKARLRVRRRRRRHHSTQQHFGRYSARKLHIICAASRGDFTHIYIYARAHTCTHARTNPHGDTLCLSASNSSCRNTKKAHSVGNLQMEPLRGPVKLPRDQAGLQDVVSPICARASARLRASCRISRGSEVCGCSPVESSAATDSRRSVMCWCAALCSSRCDAVPSAATHCLYLLGAQRVCSSHTTALTPQTHISWTRSPLWQKHDSDAAWRMCIFFHVQKQQKNI